MKFRKVSIVISICSSLALYILMYMDNMFRLDLKDFSLFSISFFFWFIITTFIIFLNKKPIPYWLYLFFPVSGWPFVFFAYMWIMWSLGGTPAP